MKRDELRNFSVRFTESVLRRIKSVAEPTYGPRTNLSEAIRRLAEERLAQIESVESRESDRARYLRVLTSWRAGTALPLQDLQFIADRAQLAYARCQRDVVSRELLIANVAAFRAVVAACKKGSAEQGLALSEGYFRSKLGTRDRKGRSSSLSDLVDRWIEGLSPYPSPSEAELAARNLAVILRDPACPSEQDVNRALAPYLETLLQLGIRAHWYGEKEPLIDPASSTSALRRLGSIRVVKNDRTEIATAGQDPALVHSLTLLSRGVIFTIANFAELMDLSEVTRLARLGQFPRGDAFQWIKDDDGKGYWLSADRTRVQVSDLDFTRIGEALEALAALPSIEAMSHRMLMAYGAI